VQRLNAEHELMRGEVNPQSQMFSYFSPESRVPAEHPLRGIKAHTDRVLKELSGQLEALYASTGRPSIPPEQLLKAQLLMALYSVRSDRLFCQMLDYNILFRWFLDMSLDDAGLDQSNFSRLRERLVSEDLAQRFFDAIVRIARDQDLLSSEHLTVDGTLIEAWAGAKSFKPKDGPPPPSDGRGGVDFRGSTRTNDTHASTTDPEAKSARKGQGKEAKLCFGGHALMENRHGLCLDIRVSSALETEPAAAAELLKRQARKRLTPTSLGGDKGYCTKGFVAFLRRKGIRPHIARMENRTTPGLDARTTRHRSYWISQKKRKRVEEIFGWMKAYGGLRRTRFRGVARVQLHAHLVGAAYNLLRLSRLQPATG
jgi:transposase